MVGLAPLTYTLSLEIFCKLFYCIRLSHVLGFFLDLSPQCGRSRVLFGGIDSVLATRHCTSHDSGAD